MLNHLPAESLTAALGDSEEREVTRYLVMTVEESSEEPRGAIRQWEVQGMFEVWLYVWGGDLQETNTEDGVTETGVVDCPDMEGRDLLGLTLSSLDYPHWI